jgi:tellurite resistance protein
MHRQHAIPLVVGGALLAISVAALVLMPDQGETDDWLFAVLAIGAGALGLLAVGAQGHLSARAERRARARRRSQNVAGGAGAGGTTDIEVSAMLRAMIATASSDGSIDPAEVATIETVFCAVTGEAFDPLLFERLVAETLSPGYAIRDVLKLKHAPIGAETRHLILSACARVMFADGSIQSAEVERLTALADLFGIDHADLHQVIHDAREEYVVRRGRA